ncbi:MAG: hypothetical protein U9N81_06485 [Bacillota bacterium]|nr:hypothetical protein [Bacillota bacterium]
MKDKENWEERLQKIEVLYQAMFDVSQQQRAFVEASGWEKKGMQCFQRWLEKRQRLMQAIEGLGIQEEEFLQDNPEGQSVWQTYREKCVCFITQIQNNDEVTRSGLEKATVSSSAKLASTRGNKKASKAYLQMGNQQPWFFDKKK